MPHNLADLLLLMLVTDDALLDGRDALDVLRAAERGGVTSVQLRLKRRTARDQVELARALVATLRIPLLINDRPDVALAAGAAGVHLGPGDLPTHLTRRIVPPGFIIGASVGSDDEVLTAGEADYWGIGPWRATATKGDAGPALGAEGFGRVVGQAAGRPCVAIGGVRPEDAAEILRTGGAGAAVVSGILGAADVEAAARSYRAALGR